MISLPSLRNLEILSLGEGEHDQKDCGPGRSGCDIARVVALVQLDQHAGRSPFVPEARDSLHGEQQACQLGRARQAYFLARAEECPVCCESDLRGLVQEGEESECDRTSPNARHIGRQHARCGYCRRRRGRRGRRGGIASLQVLAGHHRSGTPLRPWGMFWWRAASRGVARLSSAGCNAGCAPCRRSDALLSTGQLGSCSAVSWTRRSMFCSVFSVAWTGQLLFLTVFSKIAICVFAPECERRL